MRTKIAILIMVVMSALSAYSQRPGDTVTVYLNSGSAVSGSLVSNKDGNVEILATNGARFTFSAAEIRKMITGEPISSEVAHHGVTEPLEGFYHDRQVENRGFWAAAESTTGIAILFHDENLVFEEISVMGGYRFNEFIRVGAGFGARYYINNDAVRRSSIPWAMPIFATARGEFMRRAERSVVPYWSFEIGGAVRDGFFFRPAVGIRVGNLRSAFTLALSYNGQSMMSFKTTDEGIKNVDKFVSFAAIKLGYEF